MSQTPKKTKTWKQKIAKWSLELLLLIVLFNLFNLYLSRDMLKGQAKAIQTVDVYGQTVNTKNLKNQTYMLYFWGSWCPVCNFTKGNVESLSKNWPVISIALSSGDNQTLKNYLKAHQLSFTTVNDDKGYWTEQYQVVGVPAFFIINKQGDIVFAEKGYSSTIGLWLKLLYSDYFS